ncbi:MAG: hypothetical protein KDC44_12835, partial [Phaeodactylibacter sp.]|nr:hypothetical protein [Phaeodactylibacter sp.]
MHLQRTFKGLLFVACFQFLCLGTTSAQVWVNGVDVNAQPDVQYMSIRIVTRFLEIDEVFVLVDYGQENCTRRSTR